MKRSPYDRNHPSPSEELLGLLTGVKQTDVDVSVAMASVKEWLVRHLDDKELERMEERDPLWQFDNSNDDGTKYFVEWGLRVKDGKFLAPVAGTNYKPRLSVVQKS